MQRSLLLLEFVSEDTRKVKKKQVVTEDPEHL